MLKKIGQAVMLAGVGSLGAVFLSVVALGGWPDWLEPIQARLEIGSRLFGPLWFPVLIALSLAPGAAIWYIGDRLETR